MRGKACVRGGLPLKNGITPAYAGKRHLSFFAKRCGWDHPRLCGEKFLQLQHPVFLPGSPPPMRGKALTRLELFRIAGITPAYAGKRQGSYFKVAVIEDHPRLCGEKAYFNMSSSSLKGSPPPMRGKVWVSVSFGFTTRITPAYAGKSSQRRDL